MLSSFATYSHDAMTALGGFPAETACTLICFRYKTS